MMKQAWRKYLQMHAPRYTSYPSALHFDNRVDANTYAHALSAIGLYEPVSLYIHIPFCRQLCWYCGCNMRVENRYHRAHGYVDDLAGEIRLVAAALKGNGHTASVHFGGGTPNFLSTADLARILDAIEGEFGLTDDAQLAIELDPRLIRDGDIDNLARLGFSRMSLGVQDFNEETQRAINRVQPFEMIEACVAAMRQSGVDDISFDLLYGLPRQSLKTFEETIAKTIALSPDRISVFGYAHMPASLRHQRLIADSELPDEALRADLAELASDQLIDAGYFRIGFDHYAKPGNSLLTAAQDGALTRNFQGFTDDVATSTIGLGASAISFVNGVYAQNVKTTGDYARKITAGHMATLRGVVRSQQDENYSQIITDLLCRQSATLSLPLAEVGQVKRKLQPFVVEGIVVIENDTVKISEAARDLSRSVAAALDPYTETASGFAKAV